MGAAWDKLRTDFAEDAARYTHHAGSDGWQGIVHAFLANQGLQASSLYRVRRFLDAAQPQSALGRFARRLALMSYPLWARINDITTGISISPDADIGEGLFIAHYGGVNIGPMKIGKHCNIGMRTVMGKSGRGEWFGRPTIGDRVVISPGAAVLGYLSVGDDAHIGANALVTRDVPARGVVVGNPGVIVSYRGSFDYLDYKGADADPARSAAKLRALQHPKSPDEPGEASTAP